MMTQATALPPLPLGAKHGDSIRRCPYFQTETLPALALLFLRLVIGAAFVLHGQGKMGHAMTWMGPAVPGWLQAMAAFSEFGGGIALGLGLLTPLAALGLICTMTGALAMVHFPAGHPFVSPTGDHSYELALVYFAGAVLFLLNGPGCFSIDYLLLKIFYRPKPDGTLA
jgi:putative oxidoreductase